MLELKRDSLLFVIIQIGAFLVGLFWFIGGLMIFTVLLFGANIGHEYGMGELLIMLLLIPMGILIMYLAKKGVIEFGPE